MIKSQISIVIVTIVLYSCSSVSKLSTYNVTIDDEIKKNDTCSVIIFNDSHEVMYSQGTGIIDIRIDNDYFGKILIKDYIEFNTNYGNRSLILEHWDLGYFSSLHEITLKPGKNYVRVKAKPTSHQVELIDSLPANFENSFNKRPLENNYKTDHSYDIIFPFIPKE